MSPGREPIRPGFQAPIPWARKAAPFALLGAAYYLGSRLGYALIFPESYISVIWPPNTVLLVALLLSVPRRWGWLLAACYPVHVLAQWQQGVGIGMASSYYAFDCAIVPLTALALRLSGQSKMEMNALRPTLLIIAVVALAAGVGSLVWSPVMLYLIGGVPTVRQWLLVYLSNLLPFLVGAPLLMTVITRGAQIVGATSARRWVEFGLLTAALLVCGISVFDYDALERTPALLYLPLPLLLWAALRFGTTGTVAALSLLTILIIRGTLGDHGPFIGQAPAQNVLQLQYFLVALCVPLLLLASIVEEQTRTAGALQQTQADYRAVVEDQTELICRFLPDGTFTFVNGAYCRYFQRTPQQLLGRTFWEFIPVEKHAESRAHLSAITPEHPVATIEHEVITPSGEIHFQQWTDRGFFDRQGRIVDYQAVGRDVTERIRAEKSLHSAVDELKRLKDRLEAHNAYLQEELTASESGGDIICRSTVMRQMLAQTQRVAKTDTTVLILGETGVGKELLARTIHNTSARSHRPFVRLNCAALPPHLIESELFGHERGAFTGADSRRLGRFEVADGATLFLDEIGELPLALQAKLLRVLQEEEFERLGSSKTIKVDVRLIAATSRDLGVCVHQGTFRADLFYRLNVFPITVPPLRSRREDILPLASAFLAAASGRLQREFKPISNGVAESLLRHDWPGNVRELENVIERAAISSRDDMLELPPEWGNNGVEASSSAAQEPVGTEGAPNSSSNVLVTIRELERSHLLAALRRSKWRIEGPEGAAAILGMKPSTLRFRMKKLAITRSVD